MFCSRSSIATISVHHRTRLIVRCGKPGSMLMKGISYHGRYHHDHVFLSGGATAVIDLDRCRPSDPAKDAAEFIRVLRMTAFKRAYDMNRAEEATTMFLNTYLAEIPEACASLGCYWAAF